MNCTWIAILNRLLLHGTGAQGQCGGRTTHCYLMSGAGRHRTLFGYFWRRHECIRGANQCNLSCSTPQSLCQIWIYHFHLRKNSQPWYRKLPYFHLSFRSGKWRTTSSTMCASVSSRKPHTFVSTSHHGLQRNFKWTVKIPPLKHSLITNCYRQQCLPGLPSVWSLWWSPFCHTSRTCPLWWTLLGSDPVGLRCSGTPPKGFVSF